MEHHKPHTSAVFEGYYSKFDLPSGAKIALVCSKVKRADKNPNMVSFTYVPVNAPRTFQREVWADSMQMIAKPDGTGLRINLPGIGFVDWSDDYTTVYDIEHPDFSFKARTTSRTPWSEETNTPESWLVYLPLPLHWHVQSLASEFHDEKNWAKSFPSAHMWLQARDGDRGFCCAGGQILGMEAFLLGYRSKDMSIDFRPPFATRLAGMSPFLTYRTNWEDRTFELSVQSFRQKLTVKAHAPEGTFFSLSSPFPEGHRENYLGQSFQATFEVKIYESGWFSGWKLVQEDSFEGASLEFGGAYYPHAGSDKRFH